MNLLWLLLIIVLVVVLVGGLPNMSWGYGARLGGGYGPSGIIGVILIILIVLLLMGRL